MAIWYKSDLSIPFHIRILSKWGRGGENKPTDEFHMQNSLT